MRKAIYAAVIGAAAVVVSAIALFVTINSPSQLTEGDREPKVTFSVSGIDSKPFGLSYGEWNGEAWKYIQEVPYETNPANDSTGELCNMNQNDPNVHFLVGTFGGKQERKCTIPAGKALVILVGGAECSYAEDPSLRTPDDLERCAVDNTEGMKVRISIDGSNIRNATDYFSVSPVSKVTLPEGNIWDVVGSTDTEFVAAGWVFVVEALSPGEHIVEFSAEVRDITAPGEPVWSIETVYSLTVLG
jgi:hypothetical protein